MIGVGQREVPPELVVVLRLLVNREQAGYLDIDDRVWPNEATHKLKVARRVREMLEDVAHHHQVRLEPDAEQGLDAAGTHIDPRSACRLRVDGRVLAAGGFDLHAIGRRGCLQLTQHRATACTDLDHTDRPVAPVPW